MFMNSLSPIYSNIFKMQQLKKQIAYYWTSIKSSNRRHSDPIVDLIKFNEELNKMIHNCKILIVFFWSKNKY